MPNRPPSTCRHPSCRALVNDEVYCDKHRALHDSDAAYDQTTRRNDPALAIAARIRNTTQWRVLSRLHKAINPLCCDPLRQHGDWPPAAQHTHHIVPLVTRPDLAYDTSNLASLCIACHNAIERLEHNGTNTCKLFTNR